jgi:hypothetical protein
MTLTTLLPYEIRALDVDQFRKDLNALQSTDEGIVFETIYQNTAPVEIGGVSLARVVEIINGYTVTFEDGMYAVNLVGANNNIGDVLNLNMVSVRASNSAGLVEVGTSGLTAEEAATLQFVRDVMEADEILSADLAQKLHKTTKEVLVEKDVTGSNLTGTIELTEP